jgi:hypothetical protein
VFECQTRLHVKKSKSGERNGIGASTQTPPASHPSFFQRGDGLFNTGAALQLPVIFRRDWRHHPKQGRPAGNYKRSK